MLNLKGAFMKFCLSFLSLVILTTALMLATPRDTLVVAVENEPDRINPIFSEDHDAAIGMIFSGLLRFDEDRKLVPDLAESWEVDSSGLVYDFVLKEKIKWHDGVGFGAQDVAFTLEAVKNPKFNSPLNVNFEMIEKVEILSQHKIRITLSSPYPAFLDSLTLGILPKHLLDQKDLNTDPFNFAPIGTGPYVFKQWKRGQHMSLVANTNFYLGKVETPKIILKTISNPSLASVELKNGKIDAALVDFELASSFQDQSEFKLLLLESADYRALMFNLKKPIFRSKSVRAALNYAVDKESIVQGLLHSYGFVAHHPLQLSWADSTEYPTYSYDQQKALKMLKQEGWEKNQDGILQKGDQTLSFEIYVMSDDPLRVSLASILKSEFAKIGVQAKVVAKPSGSFDYTAVDTFLVGWGTPFDPDFHTYRVFSSFGDTDKNPEGWNFGHYADQRVDESLSSARAVFDLEKRKEHYANFIKAIYENPPFIFLSYLTFPLVHASNIAGIKPRIVGHHGVGFTWNIWQWSKK